MRARSVPSCWPPASGASAARRWINARSRHRSGSTSPMEDWSAPVFRAVIDAAPEGIVVCAAGAVDTPVVYANAAYERLSGYAASESIGTDLRRLQGSDREQEGRTRLRQALTQGVAARAL